MRYYIELRLIILNNLYTQKKRTPFNLIVGSGLP